MRLTSIVHILSPETDNCPSWTSGRERMTVENISWSISTKECCRPRRGSNPRPPGLQSDAHPTAPPRPAQNRLIEAILMCTLNLPLLCTIEKMLLNYRHLLPVLAPKLTLSGSNYPYLEQNFHGAKDVRATEVRLYYVKEIWCTL